MHALCCSAGGIYIRVESDVPEVLSVTEHALGSVKGDADCAVSILVKRTTARTPALSDGDGAGRTVFDLKHVTYVYDSSRLSYSVRAGEAAWGMIDCTNNSVEWHVRGPLPPRTLLHGFVLDPLSLLLPRYSVMICHGTAVATTAGAVLLFGRSGVGKSTLAFLSSHEEPDVGIRHLTDDTMVLTFSGATVEAHPVHSGFGLTPDIVQRFRLEDLPVLQRSRGKVYVSRLPLQAYGAHPVRHVIFLQKEGGNAVECGVVRLSPAQRLQALLDAQTSIANPYVRHRLTMWQRLAIQASALRVRYREYCDVTLLRDLIAVGGTPADTSRGEG